MAERPKFELNRLPSYDDDSLIAELQRVAALVEESAITRKRFDAAAKVTSGAIVRRFGGWREALEAASLADRYGGRTVNERMRQQPARGVTEDEMVAEMQRVANDLNTAALRRADFDEHAHQVKASAVERRFGSWTAALAAAGLEAVPTGRRWTDDDYFENLLEVWTHHGRQPRYAEMDHPPSRITSGAYEHKFGTWTKALVAFIDRVNTDLSESDARETSSTDETLRARPPDSRRRPTRDVRSIAVGLRYEVLRRDSFRCVLCGSSPAITRGVQLHVDHIEPVARGGRTVQENLRTLCKDCNLGKGSKAE